MLDYLEIKEIQILISFLVSLSLTINAIPVIIRISYLKDLMAKIEEKSSHEEVTPTLGGVALFASTLIGYFLWENPTEGRDMHLLISSVIILFFLGIKDDILILSPKKKLIIQIAVALLVTTLGNVRISNLFGLFGIYELNYVISLLFTVFTFISVINAFNLIDGIDGLAGTVGLFIATIYCYLFINLEKYGIATLAASLGGAILGFLRFNLSRSSKIFMGDTGSLIMGFIITYFSIKYIAINNNFQFSSKYQYDAPILAIIILLVPLFDTLRMFTIRILSGKSPLIGDRNHMHHLLIDNGLGHFTASLMLIGFNSVILGLFLFLRNVYSNSSLLLGLFIYFLIYCLIGYLLNKRLKIKAIERKNFIKIDKIKRIKVTDN